MTRRTLALVPLFLLAACSRVDPAEDGGPFQPYLASLFEPVPVSQSPTASAVVPYPFNGLFSGFKDPSLNIPNPSGAPFVTAANLTDGFSTTASIFTDFVGFVDLATASAPAAAPGLVIINGSNGAPLVPGTDYTLQVSTATDNVTGIPISDQRTRVLIEPLKPLSPSTTYLVAVTRNLLDVSGSPAQASEEFRVTRSATDVPTQAASGDTAAFLAQLTDAKKTTLETVRSALIRPGVQGFLAAYNANPAFTPDLTESDLVLAWSFTTQSISKTLQRVNTDAMAQVIGVVAAPGPGGTLSTGEIGLGLPDTADIYAGTFQVPYFLATPSNPLPDETANPSNPLNLFWRADATAPDLGASFPIGPVPCGAFAAGATINGQTAEPSFSTTICYPKPRQRSLETIPVLVTVPNANSPGGGVKPMDGWPIVIFQHGITGKRTQMLPIAHALASGGFITVAIDLPLHGIRSIDSDAGFRINGLERTFDLDVSAGSTCGSGADSTVDPSGTCFINLSSLATSRDNLRQAVSDLIHLAKSVGALDFDGGGGDIDTSRIYFVGHSLGGIVGTALLGVNTDIRAATLAMPGGGIAKLLDASRSFGPVVSGGLQAATAAFPVSSRIIEGNDNYETYMRFAQHLVDSGDPINFAAAAAATHNIHMIEIIGDTVVPNATPARAVASATQDITRIAGFLSGTDPLYARMGMDVVDPALTVPVASPSILFDAGGLDVVVPFATGTHGSILTPAGPGGSTQFLNELIEIQRQIVNFLGSDGTCLPLGGNCS